MIQPTEVLAGRYEVERRLGQGGMGAVYRVRDRAHGDRPTALKVIQVPGGVTPELRLRFKEEFLAMSRLRHPNTIEVYDYGQLDDHAQFLTMEVVEGRELSSILLDGLMSVPDALALLVQLLQALGFIHGRLFIHRDIKAENIRVTPDGTLKLMDFGLMSQLGLTVHAGRLSGSPGYLPPEVVTGGVLDASSDLYAVGCLAYELFTGRLPFRGPLMEVVRAHANQPPIPPGRLRAELPEPLEAIVLKLMAKDQRERYQSADEVLDDLSVLAGLTLAKPNLDQKKSYLKSSVLVGRDAELETLKAALSGAVAGRGRAVLVGAPAGIGKSRLVEELLLFAKLEGALVLTGRCHENGMAPYEPISQALRPLQATASPLNRKPLGPLFPEWADGPCALDTDEERLHFYEAVSGWLRAATAGRAIVLVLEDLHWADVQSLSLLCHLARHSEDVGLLLLGAYRSDEVAHGGRLAALIEDGTASVMQLGPFGLEQGKALLLSLLGKVAITPEFGDFLMDATGGNPFFLIELLRHMMESGTLRHEDGTWHFPAAASDVSVPESVEATVLRRVERLCPDAAALARVAAVIGSAPERAMLLAVSGLGEEVLFDRLDELLERQFLEKREGGYAFPHDRMREALYHHLDPAERRVLHERCGEYLEANADVEAHLYELAHHFDHGTDRAKAAHYLKRAGERAMSLGADLLALPLWERAIEAIAETDHPEREAFRQGLWREIGLNGYALSPGKAIRALEQLIAILDTRPVPLDDEDALLAHMHPYRALAIAYGLSGQPRKGLEFAKAVSRMVPPEGAGVSDDTLFIMRNTCYFASYITAGRIDENNAIARRVAERLDAMAPERRAMVLGVRLGVAIQLTTNSFQGYRPNEAAIAEAFELGRQVDDPEPILLLAMPLLWYAWTGRQQVAGEHLERLVQASRRLSGPLHPWVMYFRPYLLWQRGEFEAARALLDQGFKHPGLADMDAVRQLMVLLDGHLRLEMGERDVAKAAFAMAESRCREAGMGLLTMLALLGKGELALVAGDRAGAIRTLDEARGMAAAGPLRNPRVEGIANRLLGRVTTAEGQPERARAYLDRAMAIATSPEQDNWLEQGLTHEAFGEWHQAQGDTTAAAEAYRQAGEVYHRLKNRHRLHAVNQRLDALLNRPMAEASAVVPRAEPQPTEDRWLQLRAMQMRGF